MNPTESVMNDAVIDEIRQIRAAYSQRFHGDLRAISAEMRRQQETAGRMGITRPPKRFSPPQSKTLKPVEST